MHGIRRLPSLWVALALVLIGAAVLDLVGIGWGLPYLYHPDEPTNLLAVGQMVQQGTLNHGQWQYPAFSFDIQALVNLVAVKVGTAFGWVHGAADANQMRILVTGVGRLTHPPYLVIGRAVCVVESVATVAAAAWMARLAGGDRRSQWLTPLLVAILPISVGFSYYMTPDPLSGLTSTLAVCGALWAYRTPSWRTYAFTGAMIGLAGSSKYNCALVAISLVAAHLLGPEPRRWNRLVLAGAVALGAFLLTTPYAIFDFHGMLRGLNFDETHYSTGHVGAQGDSLGTNARWIFDSFGLFLLGLLGLWWVSARRQAIIIGIFVIAYFAVLSAVVVRFERNLLPLVPALAVLVVLGGLAVWDRARARWGNLAPAGMSAVLVAALAWTLYGTAGELGNSLTDQKAQALAWIHANVPAGDTVVLDPYSPYVDPSRWHVVVLRQRTVGGVTYPEWFVLANPPALHAANPDVVIVTALGSGRYVSLHSPIALQTQSYLTTASCARYAFDHHTIDIYVLHCARGATGRRPTSRPTS
jgi:Dolichyl-phosphate-mannose-protein mannosyltransferase